MTASALEWVVAAATVIALVVAAWELRASARTAGQAHAREAWSKYLELGFHHPQYGSTEMAIEKLGLKSAQALYEAGTEGAERYWWFLDIMLESCESLVNYFPEREWKNTIKFNLRLHRPAIRVTWKSEAGFYSDRLCRMMQEVLDEPEV